MPNASANAESWQDGIKLKMENGELKIDRPIRPIGAPPLA